MSNYSSMLRDPRWQKKRLEIMQAADFTCQDCGSKTATLNVHHVLYKSGVKPWEYPSDCLIVVCESCHVNRQEIQNSLLWSLGQIRGGGIISDFHSAFQMLASGAYRRSINETKSAMDFVTEGGEL
jgi:hypothetical protein